MGVVILTKSCANGQEPVVCVEDVLVPCSPVVLLSTGVVLFYVSATVAWFDSSTVVSVRPSLLLLFPVWRHPEAVNTLIPVKNVRRYMLPPLSCGISAFCRAIIAARPLALRRKPADGD